MQHIPVVCYHLMCMYWVQSRLVFVAIKVAVRDSVLATVSVAGSSPQ